MITHDVPSDGNDVQYDRKRQALNYLRNYDPVALRNTILNAGTQAETQQAVKDAVLEILQAERVTRLAVLWFYDVYKEILKGEK